MAPDQSVGCLFNVMSLVITNCLQVYLKEYETHLQFGSTPKTGCPDTSFSLRAMLQFRYKLNLNSSVVFVDLIKAYNSISHDMLFAILKRKGIPSCQVKVIKKLYASCEIELLIGAAKALIEHGIGVMQKRSLISTSLVYL